MDEFFLDTNVVLRTVLDGHPDLSPRAAALFDRIDHGDIVVRTTANVVFETAFVLQRTYRMKPAEIRSILLRLLSIEHILVPERELLRRTLDIFAEHNIALGDAHNVATMEQEGITRILSFDRHFDRAPGIERVEP